MKKILVLAAVFCLCFQAISIQAAPPDFSGGWELDVVKSTLPEMMRVESMTLIVTQTEKELKVESATKRAAGGMRGGAPQTATYSLEGKEVAADISGGAMPGKETRRAAMTADGKLNLTAVRVINGETGSVTIKTNEIWELLDEGNTLKITRYTETPRGATTAELFFTKRRETIKFEIKTVEVPLRIGGDTTRQINGGILNGKALSLPKPEYPAAARAVKAGGAVNVQVTIDEQGNVVSADAISGHALLRSAAVSAARGAKFSPTILEGVPVMVTGVIVYNFVP